MSEEWCLEPLEEAVDLTQMLELAREGDSAARADVIQAAYEDLRKLAAAKMQDERQNHTLTATALVHEVSLKLLNDSCLPPEGRMQFMAYAARAMRNLLIDHARTHGRQKRAGNRSSLTLDEALVASQEQKDDLIALHEALNELARIDPRKSRVVEMRYFGGMSIQETAAALGISEATVKRDWDVAKAWLLRELSQAT